METCYQDTELERTKTFSYFSRQKGFDFCKKNAVPFFKFISLCFIRPEMWRKNFNFLKSVEKDQLKHLKMATWKEPQYGLNQTECFISVS